MCWPKREQLVSHTCFNEGTSLPGCRCCIPPETNPADPPSRRYKPRPHRRLPESVTSYCSHTEPRSHHDPLSRCDQVGNHGTKRARGKDSFLPNPPTGNGSGDLPCSFVRPDDAEHDVSRKRRAQAQRRGRVPRSSQTRVVPWPVTCTTNSHSSRQQADAVTKTTQLDYRTRLQTLICFQFPPSGAASARWQSPRSLCRCCYRCCQSSTSHSSIRNLFAFCDSCLSSSSFDCPRSD